MNDLICIALSLAFLAVSWGYLKVCQELRG